MKLKVKNITKIVAILGFGIFARNAAAVSIADESPHIVLQGEFAVVDCNEDENCLIKTTKQQTCHVLALHSSSTSIGALAHFDDYVDVKGSIRELAQNLKKRSSSQLIDSFKATLIAGDEPYMYFWDRETLILEALEEAGVEVDVIRLTQSWRNRPQILLNAKDGAIHQLMGGEVNQKLECLQKREHALFFAYQVEREGYFPKFCLSPAIRYESMVPESRYLKDCSIQMDSRSIFQLPVKATRSYCKSESKSKNERADSL